MSTRNDKAEVLTPFEDPHRLAMNLNLMDLQDWLMVDQDLAADLTEKNRLLTEQRDQVYVSLPRSLPAQQELADTLLRHLQEHHDAQYDVTPDGVTILDNGEHLAFADYQDRPLELAARLVQEDLVVMEKDAERDGENAPWRLTAACVCFPTRWDLPSKLDQPLRAIHDPVPGYDASLGATVDRFFDRLTLDRNVWRLNWSLTDDNELHLPVRHFSEAQKALEDKSDRPLFLRVERQTLRRLPQTDAIIFTIRILRWPLARVDEVPGARERLFGAMETMEQDLARYKGVSVMRELVHRFFEKGTAA